MTLVPNSSCFGNPILYLSGSSIKQISSEANGKVVGKTRLEKNIERMHSVWGIFTFVAMEDRCSNCCSVLGQLRFYPRSWWRRF